MPGSSYVNSVALLKCSESHGVDFTLTLERSIRYNDTNDQCLNGETLKFENCHHLGYHQHWKLDVKTRQIINMHSKQCLSLSIVDSTTINMLDCDSQALEQKWLWTYENTTALNDWDNFGVKILS